MSPEIVESIVLGVIGIAAFITLGFVAWINRRH